MSIKRERTRRIGQILVAGTLLAMSAGTALADYQTTNLIHSCTYFAAPQGMKLEYSITCVEDAYGTCVETLGATITEMEPYIYSSGSRGYPVAHPYSNGQIPSTARPLAVKRGVQDVHVGALDGGWARAPNGQVIIGEVYQLMGVREGGLYWSGGSRSVTSGASTSHDCSVYTLNSVVKQINIGPSTGSGSTVPTISGASQATNNRSAPGDLSGGNNDNASWGNSEWDAIKASKFKFEDPSNLIGNPGGVVGNSATGVLVAPTQEYRQSPVAPFPYRAPTRMIQGPAK